MSGFSRQKFEQFLNGSCCSDARLAPSFVKVELLFGEALVTLFASYTQRSSVEHS